MVGCEIKLGEEVCAEDLLLYISYNKFVRELAIAYKKSMKTPTIGVNESSVGGLQLRAGRSSLFFYVCCRNKRDCCAAVDEPFGAGFCVFNVK